MFHDGGTVLFEDSVDENPARAAMEATEKAFAAKLLSAFDPYRSFTQYGTRVISRPATASLSS